MTSEEDKYDVAFGKIVALVQENITYGIEIKSMSSLREKYIGLLADEGINALDYRSYTLKSRLEGRWFQGSILASTV